MLVQKLVITDMWEKNIYSSGDLLSLRGFWKMFPVHTIHVKCYSINKEVHPLCEGALERGLQLREFHPQPCLTQMSFSPFIFQSKVPSPECTHGRKCLHCFRDFAGSKWDNTQDTKSLTFHESCKRGILSWKVQRRKKKKTIHTFLLQTMEGRVAPLGRFSFDSVCVCERPIYKLKTSEVKTGPPARTHFSKVSVAEEDKLLINLCLSSWGSYALWGLSDRRGKSLSSSPREGEGRAGKEQPAFGKFPPWPAQNSRWLGRAWSL